MKKIYYSEDQTYDFSVQNSSVVMLEKMFVISRTSISVMGTLFNYSLQPWVKEYLDSNADDYFKDLK